METEPSGATMAVSRILVGVLSVPFLGYGLLYIFGLASHAGSVNDVVLLPLPLAALTIAGLGCWFALSGSDAAVRQSVVRAVLFAFGFGVVGLVGGFFGPLLLTRESNPSPLLGLLIAGPLGIILGGAIGALLGRRRSTQP